LTIQLKSRYARIVEIGGLIEGVSPVKNYHTRFRDIIARDSPEKLL
jgi:hypothetical protein